MCGEPYCSVGVVSPAGARPWLQSAASGLRLWAFFPFLLCARPCPRCGGYCQRESDREHALTHREMDRGFVGVRGGIHRPGKFLGEGRVLWRAGE